MNELNELKDQEEVVSIKAPRLDPVEKLYVRAYLSKLSHSYAHKVVCPGIKKGLEDNQFSRRENIKFHISLRLQERMEALEINADKIIEHLYKEAIREDKTSSHNARIQALSLLGKHLGLFVEKKEVDNYTFQVINYSDKPIQIISSEGTILPPITEEVEETSNLIQFTSFDKGVEDDS